MSCRVCGSPLPPKRITYCSMACFNKFKKTEQYHQEQSEAIRSSEKYRAAIRNPKRMERMLEHLTKFKISEQDLRVIYVEKKLPVVEIAESYGVTPSAVYRKLKRYGIKPCRVREYTQRKHREKTEKLCRLLREKYRAIPLVRHIPDIIFVDFHEQKVFGVEVVATNRNLQNPRKKREKILEQRLLDDVFIVKGLKPKEDVDSIMLILKRQR